MNHDSYADDYIISILREVRTIALIGASNNESRPSHVVMRYLLAKGYAVHPVNPGIASSELAGRMVYGSLAEVPAPVDMVDIFRNSAVALEVTRAAIRLKDKLAIKVIWMQLGVRSDEAAAEAEAVGLKVVMNRCPKIELGRLGHLIDRAGAQ